MFCTGAYSLPLQWSKILGIAKLAAPAVAGQLSVALQGAGLVYTSGAV